MDIIQKIEGSNVDGVYNLPKKHLNGRVFFSIPGLQLLTPEKYLDCIKLLKPLFKMPDFRDITPGFYINYIKDENVPNGGLRLNYYTVNATETIKAIEDYASENSEKIVLFKRENADTNKPPEEYNDGDNEKELRFRNFLNTNTQIALDVLESFEQPFRVLVYHYRHFLLPNKMPPELVFEPTFSKYSDVFRKLKNASLDTYYWKDLIYYHGENRVGLHFLVNMVAVDENYTYDSRFFKEGWFL